MPKDKGSGGGWGSRATFDSQHRHELGASGFVNSDYPSPSADDPEVHHKGVEHSNAAKISNSAIGRVKGA